MGKYVYIKITINKEITKENNTDNHIFKIYRPHQSSFQRVSNFTFYHFYLVFCLPASSVSGLLLVWPAETGMVDNQCNGSFAASGHMVQNPPCWRASCPLGHPKQSDFIKTNLHFLCFGCPSA